MSEKEKTAILKNAFKHYNENKAQLRNLSYEGLRAVDYTKERTGKRTATGDEQKIVRYLDQKRTLENHIKIVERVMWFYWLTGGGKYEYIVARWVKGMKGYRAAMECYITEHTAYNWGKEIMQTAARAADLFNLW